MSVLLLFCSSCGVIVGSSNRPYNLPDTTWVSESPNIYFESSKDKDKYIALEMPGEMIYNETTSKIIAIFDYGAGFGFE